MRSIMIAKQLRSASLAGLIFIVGCDSELLRVFTLTNVDLDRLIAGGSRNFQLRSRDFFDVDL